MTPNNQNNMANPRRNSISTNYQTPISNPDTNSQFQTLNSLKLFLKKPHSFPFLLSIFLFLTWVFLRLQRPPPPPSPHLSAPSYTAAARKWSGGNDDDRSANLVRYSGLGFPSPIAKDNRGWMIDPISFAYKAGLSALSYLGAQLEREEDIRYQLPRAISESRVLIIVFSKSHAASGWCLDEQFKIMEYRRDFKQIVLPIFYHVDPSDVMKPTGVYAKAFEEHKDRFKGTSSMERLRRWREALTQSGNLSDGIYKTVISFFLSLEFSSFPTNFYF